MLGVQAVRERRVHHDPVELPWLGFEEVAPLDRVSLEFGNLGHFAESLDADNRRPGLDLPHRVHEIALAGGRLQHRHPGLDVRFHCHPPSQIGRSREEVGAVERLVDQRTFRFLDRVGLDLPAPHPDVLADRGPKFLNGLDVRGLEAASVL